MATFEEQVSFYEKADIKQIDNETYFFVPGGKLLKATRCPNCNAIKVDSYDSFCGKCKYSDRYGKWIEYLNLHYDPFGNELTPNSCPELRHRFIGKETDRETDLVNFGEHYYLPYKKVKC